MGGVSIFGDSENLDWSKNLNILQGTIFNWQKDGQNDVISIFSSLTLECVVTAKRGTPSELFLLLALKLNLSRPQKAFLLLVL